MMNLFRPDWTAGSVYRLDYRMFYKMGFRGIIFDIDNPLVPQDAPIDKKAKRLIAKLRRIGFSVCLISNNGEEQVRPFRDAADIPGISKAGKPGKKGFFKAVQALQTTPGKTLFLGDQVFTDVAGAKRCGIRCVLVDPVDPGTDTWFVKLKRKASKLVFRQAYAPSGNF